MKFGDDNRRILEGDEGAQLRSLYKSMGYTNDDLRRPMIGVVNSWNTACSGQFNLRAVAESVKNGIYRAGGTPVEFGTIGPCDGIGIGNNGMKYILPSRDLIAQSVEVMASAHSLDAVVLLGSCDKIVPGLLMAAARLNIPAILVPGGPMLPGKFENKFIDVNQVMINLGALYSGKLTKEKFKELERVACPTSGSCQMMGTANTFCSFSEAIGMSLPSSAAIPAVYSERLHSAQDAGKKILELFQKNIRPRDIMTKEAIINGIRVAMAVGGSTNLILHTMALVNSLDIDFKIDEFNDISDSTPYLCSLAPADNSKTMIDYYFAGGAAVVMKELESLLDLNCITVSGNTLKENLKVIINKDNEMIRPISRSFRNTGGLAILRGNLAPDSAVTRPAVIAKECRQMCGPAKVFNSENEFFKAINKSAIKEGDVIVVRYEGPRGGPGMREMFIPLEIIKGMGLEGKVAIITDGRFSGSNSGSFVGHICPEAADGGPIASVKDGDIIDIDIDKKTINMRVSDDEIKNRLKNISEVKRDIGNGYLSFYVKHVSPSSKGAVLI
ncbi:MAG: dihydroxy-acid dehydratase [Actinomycetota bacterium]|nr:dihydroxy-acid dehydratase [Actinomycetota bacterium]